MLKHLLLALLAALSTASAASTEKVNQQLDVSPGGTLVVDVEFGHVEVSAGSDNHVDIQAERTIASGDKEEEKAYLDSAPILVSQNGNTVTILAKRQKGELGHWRGNVTMNASYLVKVPRSFQAEIHSGGGNLQVRDLEKGTKANTAGGKLKFAGTRGSLEGTTAGGDITLSDCEGSLVLKTSGGRIDSTGGGGTFSGKSAGGSIAVDDFKGDTTVRTSGGRLSLARIQGRIDGHTAGGAVEADLLSPIPGDVHLDTSAGSIDIAVAREAGFELDARTDVGRVRMDSPVAGSDAERGSVLGQVNGGGKRLVLRSGAGSIEVHSIQKDTVRR